MKFDLSLQGQAFDMVDLVSDRIQKDEDERQVAVIRFGKFSTLLGDLVAESRLETTSAIRLAEIKEVVWEEVMELFDDALWRASIDKLALTTINMVANGIKVKQERAA